MTPSTSKPQDAFKIHRGTWTCRLCNVHDKGGQNEWMRHYLREHYVPPKATS